MQAASVQAYVFSCQICFSWNSQCVKVQFKFFQSLRVWNVLSTQPQWIEVEMKGNPFWRHFPLPLLYRLMWRKELNFQCGDNGIAFPVRFFIIQSNCVLILPTFLIPSDVGPTQGKPALEREKQSKMFYIKIKTNKRMWSGGGWGVNTIKPFLYKYISLHQLYSRKSISKISLKRNGINNHYWTKYEIELWYLFDFRL